MKEIIDISTHSPLNNFDIKIEFAGETYRIIRLGCDYDMGLMYKLLFHYDGKVDALCITGVPPELKIGPKIYAHRQLEKLQQIPQKTPLLDGQTFVDVYLPWSIRKICGQHPALLRDRKVGFYTGIVMRSLVSAIEEISHSVTTADPYFIAGVAKTLRGSAGLEKFFAPLAPILTRRRVQKVSGRDFSSERLKKHRALRDFDKCEIFVTAASVVEMIEVNDLKGKTVIIDSLRKLSRQKLEDAGVSNIINCMPEQFSEYEIGFAILEAIFQLHKGDLDPITEDEVLGWIQEFDLKPKMHTLVETTDINDEFAFVIHPLSFDDIFRHPALRPLRSIKNPIQNFAQKVSPYVQGVHYGKIEGIESIESGKKVTGHIYSIFDTPRAMMKADTQVIYKKLVKIATDAKKRGAKLMGLGAYTKIVGDAGVTVAKRSPIPVTTGNSLSAASTLWAAAFVVDKMGFVGKNNGIYDGKVMVVGATGSIGKVSAKLLSMTWREIVLVAPRADKLLELKDEITSIAPHCKIAISTEADKFSSQCDLIVTTTSAQGKKILDIEKLKPGCVVCDVSRPFDISESDALKRPDVLVIASGEVELPGKVKISCDIGLPGNVVYACLAETAILMLENRAESFTLSRNLNFNKVKEIDRLARKHGVRLSAIMGHQTEITDEEIQLCRQHAEKKRDALGMISPVLNDVSHTVQ